MEVRLMVSTVVGGHGSVVGSGRVQGRRVEVRIEHVGRRWWCGGHGWCLQHRRRVFDSYGRGHSRRGRRVARRQFPFRSTSRQEVPQVRLVPASRLRRLRLASHARAGGRRRSSCRAGQRARELFRVAEVAVRQTGVQITDFKVHCPFAQQITAFLFPV